MNILKELVTNILIHRDYKGRNPARILIYKDKIVVENSSKKNTYKNNIIEDVFKIIGYTDGIESGLNKVRNLCEKYFYNEPLIEDMHIFRVTIYYKNTKVIKNVVKSDEEIIISYIKENGSITSELARKILNKEKTYSVKLLNELIN